LPRPVASIDEQEVLRAITIGIEKRHARTESFRKIFLSERSARMTEMDARGRGDVGELRESSRGLRPLCRYDKDTSAANSQNGSSQEFSSF
jgi:hypothetical protein